MPKEFSDTIAAIATPPGEGAVGIVRLSGPDAPLVSSRIFRGPGGRPGPPPDPFRLTLGRVVDPRSGEQIDEVLSVHMPAPTSYTGEHVIEFQAHGGPLIMERILGAVLAAGARVAAPGEFTRRAFLNGRLDLSQAEAVIDLIRSRSEGARRTALHQLQGRLSRKTAELAEVLADLAARAEAELDFGDEEGFGGGMEERELEAPAGVIRELLSRAEEGRVLREGLQICVCGRTNVGKSSLVNMLLDSDRSIVTPHPGTTRDTVESRIAFGDLHALLIDTAGFGSPRDPVEEEGIRRSRQKISTADLSVLVLDSSSPLAEADRELLRITAPERSLLVLNKSDLEARLDPAEVASLAPGRRRFVTSALTGEGVESLRAALSESLRPGDGVEDPLVANARHCVALQGTLAALDRAREALSRGRPLEVVAADLRAARTSLGEITGETASEDLLDRIFGQFCIGK